MDKTERELREMLNDRRLLRWPTEPQWNAIWIAANAKGHTGGVSAAVHGVDATLLDKDWADMMDIAPADAKMMWAEICVRRSVSPFVDVNTPFTDAQKADDAFQRHHKELTESGWQVYRNSPEGVEFRAPKRMKLIDKIFLGIGVVTLFFYGLGLLFIAYALADYFIYTEPPATFLPRPGPGPKS